MQRSPTFAFFLVCSACALKGGPVEPHKLYADDNQVLESQDVVRFAVVGNSRDGIPWGDRGKGLSRHKASGARVAADLEQQVIAGALDFVVWLGDEVRWSTASEWSRFGVRHAESLDSTHLPNGEHPRVPSLVVAGDRDFVLDKKLARLEDSFPGLGAEIGFNRVASWYTFDLKAGEQTWRFMALDSNKDALGSRWGEQDAWIPRAAKGDYDHLLIFMHHPRLTLALGEEMNKDNVPRGLIDAVELHTGILKLRTVFSGDSHTSEVFLPEGVIGTAYVGAGGGGAVASDLERWGDGSPAGYEDIQLEPLFDLALQKLLVERGEREDVPQKVFDRARAEGEWAGFTGAYDAGVMPLSGYWIVELEDGEIRMRWRYVNEAGEGTEPYRLSYVRGPGWKSGGTAAAAPAPSEAPPAAAE
jgi:hypothetical protein